MLGPNDVVIEVRLRSFGRAGVVDLDDVDDGQFIKRANATGAWKMTLPNEAGQADNLKVPGSGIIVYLYDQVYLSGPMLNWTKDEDSDDLKGTSTFVGADDMCYLSFGTTYPTPTTDNVTLQSTGWDVRTGNGESIMKAYVNANIGPGAPTARRQPIGNTMTIEANANRGGSATYSARFDKLGAVLATIGAAAGLGFDVKQTVGGQPPQFSVYVPQDRSSTVVMDIANDLLESTSSGIGAPSTTRAIVAGQGEGSARTLIEVNDADSLAAEQLWGFRAETFIDQRNTDDSAELTQAGVEEITANGRTTVSLKVVPADANTMVFFKDWFVSDTVAVVVDDQKLKDVVSESILVVSSDDIRIGATIGNPTGYDWESVLIGKVANHERRIAFLEKNQ